MRRAGLLRSVRVYMRIDAHQHFWHYEPDEHAWIDHSIRVLRRDFLPEDLKPELQRAGIDATIAVQARQSLEETRWLLALAATESFIAGVIGWVDLRSPDVKSQLAEFAGNPKLLGIRHIVQSEPDDRFLLNEDFLRGIAALKEFGLTYDILIYPRHLPVVAEFVRRFPDQQFVLDHMAKPFIKRRELQPWKSDIAALAKFKNVACKLSGLVTEANWEAWEPEHLTPYIDVAFEAFGPERLMIGSDWPVCTLAGSYSQVMNVVEGYLCRFPDNVRQAVFGSNAEKLWSLRTRDVALRGH